MCISVDNSNLCALIALSLNNPAVEFCPSDINLLKHRLITLVLSLYITLLIEDVIHLILCSLNLCRKPCYLVNDNLMLILTVILLKLYRIKFFGKLFAVS